MVEVNEDDIRNDENDTLHVVETREIDFQKKLGIFLLSLREKYKLPSIVLPQIVSEFITMICHHQAYFSRSISEFITSCHLGDEETSLLKSLLEERSDVENAFSSLETEYKINKFARFKLNYIKPVQYKPDRNRPDTYQYVPILDTLQNLLSHDDVFSYVVNSHKSADGILRDFCDGELYKRNELFRDDPSALQIMLFFDEFTAVNPLGHQIKNYKKGGFYMLLGNLPPKFRSQLYCIQLVALCTSPVIKHNGYGKILEPLINDLQTLETEGIIVSKADGDRRLYGSVSLVIADNLGAHSLGGFMESFTTLRNCRFCFITRDAMQRKIDCQNFNMRSKDMHSEHVRLVQGDPSLVPVYGVKGNSPLNSLNYYHIINGMPSDLAHDLFEGVVCEVMKNVIIHCVSEDYFSLDDLNDQIVSFSFSEVDKSNKPAKVSQVLRNFKVKQSAAQVWCFVRHLPLLVGIKVPENDQKWECLLKLRDMLFYVCAVSLGREHVLSMADVIEEFHESFRTCFPDVTITPKFHYTLHYPHLTLLFGPLVHLQTLRFEGKHNYFKELVFRTKNRKNICKSLAERHQYYQCTFNTGGMFLSDGNLESTGGSSVALCLLNDQLQQLLSEIVHGEEVFLCKSVKYFGISYWKDTCIVLDVQGFEMKFGKIEHCAICNGVPYLLCRKMRTCGFQRHYHAFTVACTDDYIVCKISELYDPNPLGIYNHPNGQCQSKLVVPKYKVL